MNLDFGFYRILSDSGIDDRMIDAQVIRFTQITEIPCGYRPAGENLNDHTNFLLSRYIATMLVGIC